MKLDADEKELLESVEGGEWKPAGGKRTRPLRACGRLLSRHVAVEPYP